MREILNRRLLSASKYVRAGAVLADIGTDHGHLPIFLLENGTVQKAILADINEGPLNKARENIESCGFSDKVEFYLTDGVSGLENLPISDYTICGMGGELIAKIIENKYLAREGVRLIVQPMTRPYEVRRTLCKLGFEIVSESCSCDRHKFYTCICADYVGKTVEITNVEAEIGDADKFTKDKDSTLGYFEMIGVSLKKRRLGLSLAGKDTSYFDEIIDELEARIKKLKEL